MARVSRFLRTRTVVRLLASLAVVYVVALLMAIWLEEKFIYFPSKYPAGDWTLPANAKDVTFEASDGTRLHGWWLAAENPRATIVYSHGNGGNITHRKAVAENLRNLGANVFLYDYRGYGRSEGRPFESGIYLDGEAAWDCVVGRFGAEPGSVVLFGESLGCSVALQLALKRQSAGVILQAPFTNFREMAWKTLPIPIGWALSSKFDNLEAIERLKVPLLVIHGEEDSLVPISMGKRVFEGAKVEKWFVSIPGAGHNDVPQTGGAGYYDSIAGFLSAVLGG